MRAAHEPMAGIRTANCLSPLERHDRGRHWGGQAPSEGTRADDAPGHGRRGLLLINAQQASRIRVRGKWYSERRLCTERQVRVDLARPPGSAASPHASGGRHPSCRLVQGRPVRACADVPRAKHGTRHVLQEPRSVTDPKHMPAPGTWGCLQEHLQECNVSAAQPIQPASKEI
jgi:hypothetical protein